MSGDCDRLDPQTETCPGRQAVGGVGEPLCEVAHPRRLSGGEGRRRGRPGRGGGARDHVGDRVPEVADQRFRRAEPHRARAGNRQGVRGRREGGGEFTQPAEVGRIERPGPPDVRVIGADSRQETAAGHQAHARGSGRGPDPGAAPHRPPGLLAGIDGEQRRKSLGERDEIRRDQALAYAVGAAGENQLQLGGSRALAPEREHAAPGNLARYEDQFAVQHETARYRTIPAPRAPLAELSGCIAFPASCLVC